MNIKLKDREINLDSLNEEQQDKLLEFLDTLQVEDDPFKINPGDTCYIADRDGEVDPYHCVDPNLLAKFEIVGNVCKDKDLAQVLTDYCTLLRLMWRYSIQHGGRRLLDRKGWQDINCPKYCCVFNILSKEWQVGARHSLAELNAYFINEETAENCIKEVINPFIAEHPALASIFS